MSEPELVPYSPDPTLTPAQHRVLALLAEGCSLSHAAAESGIHRNTIRNWRRTVPAFAREIEFAVREQALVWHELSIELAPRAARVLAEILDNPQTAPALRLRAALAILKTASDPQPRPLRAFPTAAPPVVHPEPTPKPAQSCTTPPARNSPCTCGSGQRYKRCCANMALPGTGGDLVADSCDFATARHPASG